MKLSKPQIDGPLGIPPFEKPSIAKAVTNFVLYKFGHLAQKGTNGPVYVRVPTGNGFGSLLKLIVRNWKFVVRNR